MTMTTVQAPQREHIYYAVPTHYSIGPAFDTFDEAVEHARSTIVMLDYRASGGPVSYSRAFVDQRVQSKEGDLVTRRWEVFRDGRALDMAEHGARPEVQPTTTKFASHVKRGDRCIEFGEVEWTAVSDARVTANGGAVVDVEYPTGASCRHVFVQDCKLAVSA